MALPPDLHPKNNESIRDAWSGDDVYWSSFDDLLNDNLIGNTDNFLNPRFKSVFSTYAERPCKTYREVIIHYPTR
jgi:hypothetical protein